MTNQDALSTIIYAIYFFAFISIFYIINHRRNIKIEWGCKEKHFSILPLALLVVIIFQLGLNSPVNSIIKNIFGFSHPALSPFDSLTFLIGAIILGPIFEEIIFRGIFLRGLLFSYSPKYAIIISSVLFGIIHVQPFQIWGAILLGLFFGLIYYKTQNIIITIILHSISNTSSFLNIYFSNKFATPNFSSDTIQHINIVIVIISLIILITLFRNSILKLSNIELKTNESIEEKTPVPNTWQNLLGQMRR